MERMQIYLAQGQRVRLDALARQRSKPVAQLVREAVEQYLASEGTVVLERDGLFDLVGADGGRETGTDTSERHHELLAKAAHWEQGPRRGARARRTARKT
jgi:hypothetical protein